MDLFYRFSGTESSASGSYSLTGTTPSVLASTTFTGLSHFKNGTSTLEAGAVLTSGTKGVKLSQLATVITYTLPSPPTVTTNDATNLATNGATLNSTVNPNGSSTFVGYMYGTSNVSCASLSSSTSGISAGSGTTDVSPNSINITSLTTSTLYYFCAVASNTGGFTYGNVLTFTTLP